MFEFKVLEKDSKTKARVGQFSTAHGKLLTPELAFVATEGQIKSIPKDILPKLPIKLIIVNTFHTFIKNIIPKIEGQKGVHRYLNYKGVVTTDSGGFQVFSLGFGKTHRVGKLAKFFGNQTKIDDTSNPLKINEEGVTFSYDNKPITLTPELSIKLQELIGADIIFAFDECTSPYNSYSYNKKALQRTHQWLKICLKTKKRQDQALFGIVQGSHFEDLRKESAKFVSKQNVQGFGIGGSLGRSKEDLWNIVEWVSPLLPEEKPRHLLGIGQVRDMFEAVERGIDLFDCVIPTREARHKVLYTNHGRVNIKKYRNLDEVLEKGCKCLACKQKITYRLLNQLFSEKDPRAFILSTIHNVQFFADLMENIRLSIGKKTLREFKNALLRFYP